VGRSSIGIKNPVPYGTELDLRVLLLIKSCPSRDR
jgi:hypothetical protein